jgi:L-malate glycosyltransferase
MSPAHSELTRPRVLFVSYNSLVEPLGPTQILPYVRALAASFDLTVLSFEKPVRSAAEDARDRANTEALLAASGVAWIRLPYHKRPSLPATLFDIAAGIRRVVGEHRRRPFGLIHARGYVPAAIALGVKKRRGIPFLFDIRGLQAEEYVDAGHWRPRGLRFRLTKWVEQSILRNADGIVTLTEVIKPIIQQFRGLRSRPALPPWAVIPSCVDLDAFRFDPAGRQAVRDELGIGDRPVLVYSGSIGTWYLVDEMLDFYRAARERWPGLFLLMLINRAPDAVVRALRDRQIPEGDFAVRWVRHEHIAAYLSAADAGIAFIRPCLSKRSSSPTKYAEYLACGLPFAANSGIGDVDALLERTGCGTLVQAGNPEGYAAAADQLRRLVESGDRSRYRDTAEREFSVTARAYPAYRQLYGRILARRPRRRALFLTPYPLHSAPSQRLKFEQYYASFEDCGIQVVVSPFVSLALWRVLYRRGYLGHKALFGAVACLRRLFDLWRAPRFDVVYVHLWALPFGPPWFEEFLSRSGVKIVYDIDDLIYLPRASAANPFVRRLRREKRIERIMQAAAHVVVCTTYLRDFATPHNPNVTLISSTIDTDLYQPRRHSDERQRVTIGWSGSHSTSPYLQMLGPALRELGRRFDVRLLVIGDADFRLDGVAVEARPWSVERETATLREMDIGVYPLPDEEWVLGKSGLKALQYMGVGVPVVASRIGAACEFIRDGDNGFLAASTDEWIEKLSRLITDPALRASMGSAGRRTVEERFSVRVTAPVYVHVLDAMFTRDPVVATAAKAL